MSTIYQPGEIIADGRYEIIRLVGEGGAGAVYQAKDKLSFGHVAIKVLRQELLEDDRQVEIFKHEGQLAARLDHPYIVALYETITDQFEGKTIYFLVMEYLTGGNLASQKKSTVALEKSIKWMKQLLQATAYAHDRGVIHQDIKSANIFLNDEANVKIGDFGLARLVDDSHLENLSVFHFADSPPPQKKGTPAYMSPELCYGEMQDERSDIYSLGVLFFELLTGQLPFNADGMIELAKQHISQPVPSIVRLNPALPEVLDKVVKRMMAKEKDLRYQSARQILSVLEDL